MQSFYNFALSHFLPRLNNNLKYKMFKTIFIFMSYWITIFFQKKKNILENINKLMVLVME
jgi:hypothetical protein